MAKPVAEMNTEELRRHIDMLEGKPPVGSNIKFFFMSLVGLTVAGMATVGLVLALPPTEGDGTTILGIMAFVAGMAKLLDIGKDSEIHKAQNSAFTKSSEEIRALGKAEGMLEVAKSLEEVNKKLALLQGERIGIEKGQEMLAATAPPVVTETEATGPHVVGEMVAVTTPVRGTEDVVVQQKAGSQ